ncbi:hypothetical protein [Lactobacillus kalixensis]|uniref:Uncharacterized protein n=1 Tax=Lactobacillus kalixensis DSM 16043 TaxID=1423763 RepID=A0A0R1UCS8_9LACO|nr:hypothetical protein [Lactobacillus kalixensis]KRL91212.1 hypothetical protein FC46_GL001043 [Lactobacillus kalixensis DSM 16043]
MTDQDKKERILNKLKNIVYFTLGITVFFLSIRSIIQAHGNFGSIIANTIWLLLSLIVIVEGAIGIKKSLENIPNKARKVQIVDWIFILASLILANIAYLAGKNNLIIFFGIIFIASCIPIKEKDLQ